MNQNESVSGTCAKTVWFWYYKNKPDPKRL